MLPTFGPRKKRRWGRFGKMKTEIVSEKKTLRAAVY
jgi:hypothetical protein